MADNRIAFGLCKEYGIELPDRAKPADAWEALNKRGITVSEEDPVGEFKEKSVETLEKRQRFNLPNDEYRELPIAQEFTGFKRPDHLAHAREMGYTPKEYRQAAIAFFNSSKGMLYYGEKRDRFARYNPKTQEYVVCDLSGDIKTYYKITEKKFRKIEKQEGYKLCKK